jgi:F-type H+-transporting ATP synthase subunit e
LTFGVFYGFTHQSAIFAREKSAAAHHEYERKSKLIDNAKAAYAEKTSPKKGDGGEFCIGGEEMEGNGASWHWQD